MVFPLLLIECPVEMLRRSSIRSQEEYIMTKFEIVWRNPETVKAAPRRHSLEPSDKHELYILQEFVDDGYLGYWTTISDLEVLVGGHAA